MITQAEIERYLLTSIDSSFAGQVETWIAHMTKYIETTTGQQFSLDTVATAKKYDGDGSQVLLVDKYSELTSVAVSGTTITVFEYPANTVPKYKLVTDSRFPIGRQNIEVTAKWGQTPPEDIQFACLVLTAGIIQKQTNKDVQSEKIGDYQVTYLTEAQQQDFNRANDIIANYTRLVL